MRSDGGATTKRSCCVRLRGRQGKFRRKGAFLVAHHVREDEEQDALRREELLVKRWKDPRFPMSLLKSIKFGQTTACRDSRRSRVFVPKVVCFMTSEERQAMNDPTKSEPMKMYLRTRDETALFVAHEGSENTGRRQCLSHGGSSEAQS